MVENDYNDAEMLTNVGAVKGEFLSSYSIFLGGFIFLSALQSVPAPVN